MKRKEGYILRNVGKSYIIVPVAGKTIQFREMVTVNETGAYLWELLKKETSEKELLEKVLLEYRIDCDTAKADIKEFLQKAENVGIIS